MFIITLGEVDVFQCIDWLFFFVGIFSQFHKKFQNDALLDFRHSHESESTTQHGHTQTRLRGKPTDSEGRIQSCSILEASRSIAFYSLLTATTFPGRVLAVPLLNIRIL
jgi:hypothetical protein